MPSCKWSEYPGNPVYNPPDTPAYYQTVRYSSTGFTPFGLFAYYKMWYDFAGSGGIAFATSPDGVNWTWRANTTNLLSTARHSRVLFDPSGFGGGAPYRIWYWDSSKLFVDDPIILNMLRTAFSSDGVHWSGDTTLFQDENHPLLVPSPPSPYFNKGSFGPADILYFPANPAALDLINPFNNRYVMYYDVTDRAREALALAVSVDGIVWSKVGPPVVLPIGGPGTWDEYHATLQATVLRLAPNNFIMWYSGGVADNNEGIGCATSSDGVNWTKSPGNPVLSRNDGIAWRNSRTYNPCVLFDRFRFNGHGDPVCYKLWLTGASTAPSDTTIGYSINQEPCDDHCECFAVIGDPDKRNNLGLDTPNGPDNPIPDCACHDICAKEITMISSQEIHRNIPYPPVGPCRLGPNIGLPPLAANQQCSLYVTCADETLGLDCASVTNNIGLLAICTSENASVVALPLNLVLTFNTFFNFPSCDLLYFSQVRSRMQEIDGSCILIQLRATVNSTADAILIEGKVIDKLWKYENLWLSGLIPYGLNQEQRDEGFISVTVDSAFVNANHPIALCPQF